MQTVLRLYERGYLTARQALAAARYRQDLPAVAPSTRAILDALVIEDCGLTEAERRFGWSARSAKTVLRVLLDGFSESASECETHESDPDDLKAQIDYLTGADLGCAMEIMDLMVRYGLTKTEARVVGALMNRGTVHYEVLFRAVYADRCEADWPGTEALKMIVHKARSKVAPEMTIKALHGVGYQLERADSQVRAA